MYKVDDPKFFIDVYVERKHFINVVTNEFDEDYVKFIRNQLMIDFYYKFRGVRFEIEFKRAIPSVIFTIKSPNILHKTIANKIVKWLRDNNLIESVDVRYVE